MPCRRAWRRSERSGGAEPERGLVSVRLSAVGRPEVDKGVRPAVSLALSTNVGSLFVPASAALLAHRRP